MSSFFKFPRDQQSVPILSRNRQTTPEQDDENISWLGESPELLSTQFDDDDIEPILAHDRPTTPNEDDVTIFPVSDSPELVSGQFNDNIRQVHPKDRPTTPEKGDESTPWVGDSPEFLSLQMFDDICLELDLEDCNTPYPNPQCKCRSCTSYYKQHPDPAAVAEIHTKALKTIKGTDLRTKAVKPRRNKLKKAEPVNRRDKGTKLKAPSAENGEPVIPPISTLRKAQKWMIGWFDGE